MAWKNIGNFLNRFINLKPSKKIIQEESAKIISSLLNIKIESESFEERDGVLYIKIPNPVLRNEIFFKKDLILKKIQEKLGNKSLKDLRF